MGNLPTIPVVQRVSARRIISTVYLSIKWHLLMDRSRHTLTTDVTDVIARILSDYHSRVKIAREYNVRGPAAHLYAVSCKDNLANETCLHLEIVETIS